MSNVQTLKIYFNDPVSPELAIKLTYDLIELIESHGLTFTNEWGEEEVEEVDDGEQS